MHFYITIRRVVVVECKRIVATYGAGTGRECKMRTEERAQWANDIVFISVVKSCKSSRHSHGLFFDQIFIQFYYTFSLSSKVSACVQAFDPLNVTRRVAWTVRWRITQIRSTLVSRLQAHQRDLCVEKMLAKSLTVNVSGAASICKIKTKTY